MNDIKTLTISDELTSECSKFLLGLDQIEQERVRKPQEMCLLTKYLDQCDQRPKKIGLKS